ARRQAAPRSASVESTATATPTTTAIEPATAPATSIATAAVEAATARAEALVSIALTLVELTSGRRATILELRRTRLAWRKGRRAEVVDQDEEAVGVDADRGDLIRTQVVLVEVLFQLVAGLEEPYRPAAVRPLPRRTGVERHRTLLAVPTSIPRARFVPVAAALGRSCVALTGRVRTTDIESEFDWMGA